MKRYKYELSAPGVIAINQPDCYGWPISWNPDTQTFCAHDKNDCIVQQRSRIDNLVQWCRKHKK